MELKALLEQLVLEAQDQAAEKAEQEQLTAAFKTAFNKLGATFDANRDKIELDMQQADKLEESFTVATTMSLLLSIPSVMRVLGKAFSALNKLVKKLSNKSSQEEESRVVEMLLTAADKWYTLYIKGFMWILQTSGFYEKANITDKATQKRFAEVLYYAILAGLAVHSGIQSIDSIEQIATDFSEKGASNIDIDDINIDTFLKAKDSVISSATVKQFASVLFKNKI